jgi:iron complex outermembrane receptor protein
MKISPIVSTALFAFATCAHAQEPAPTNQEESVTSAPQAEAAPAADASTPLPVISLQQTPDETRLNRASASEPRGIEEVLVTATKRETSVREIPFSIDALKGDDLVEKGATNLDEIVKKSPGVNISGDKIAVRGVALSSQQSLQSGSEAGRFLDDTSMNAPSTQGGLGDFDPYDMSTVEILKGPQSTLFGGTALSGAIRYVPKKPSMDAFGASLRTGYGDVAHADGAFKELSAMVNVPVFDTFALRVAGTVRDKPNVIDDTFGGRTDNDSSKLQQIRYMARWEATERLRIDVSYLDYKRDRNFTFIDNPDRYETATKRMAEPSNTWAKLGTVNAQYTFDSFSIVGIVNQMKNGSDYLLDASPVLGTSQTGPVPIDTQLKVKVPSYELRLVSNEPSQSDWALFSNWDYLIGLYYMKADQNARAEIAAAAAGAALTTDSTVDVNEKALFLNLTRHLFDDRLSASVGARVAKSDLDADTIVTYGGLIPREFIASQPDSRVNPSATLMWKFTDAFSFHASYAEGFRFGGANTALTLGIEDIPPTFSSDTLRNYEVGIRSDWLDRSLRIDVTPFLIDWTNLQLTQISPLAMNYTSNVGSARIKGIESQMTWQVPNDWPLIPAGLTFTSGLSYLDARTAEDFESANGPAAKGTRLPLSSKRSATVGLSWRHSWNDWDVSSSLQGAFASSRKNDLIETYRLPGYQTYNGSFRLSNHNWPGAPAITLTAINFTDEFILYNATPVTSQPGNFVYVPQSLPRLFELSLELSF